MYALSILVISISSCKKSADINVLHFRSLIKITDPIELGDYLNVTANEIKTIDIAFAAIKDPAPADITYRNNYKAKYYMLQNLYDSATLYIDSSLSLLQNHLNSENLSKLYLRTLLWKGVFNYYNQNYDEAIRNYTTAKLHYDPKLNDSSFLCNYYNGMSIILSSQDKYLQAIEFCRNVINIAPGSSKKANLVFAMMFDNFYNMGQFFDKIGMNDSAIHYYNALISINDQYEKKIMTNMPMHFEERRALAYGKIAAILQHQKKMRTAEPLYLKSYKVFKKNGDVSYMRFLLPALASFYIETNQLKRAGIILGEATHVIDTFDTSPATSNYYKIRSDYYFHTNQVAAANASLLRSYQIKDSIGQKEKHFIATDITLQIENSEKKKLNQELTKDNQIKQGYLFAALITSVLAVSVLFLAWYNLKRKSDYSNKLVVLNTEITLQNKDLEKTLVALEKSLKENNRIVRVVAHDLKNPLSGIRSLIYSLLKKEQTENNKEIFELIETTCVESIALINDLLNNNRTLTEISKELVDMGKLIEQCVELCQVKAGEKNQQLRLQVDYPLLMLNKQKIIRVISNIVNNAIKFSPAGADINVKLQRKDNSVLLCVLDHGIGIPIGFTDKLFSVNSTTSRAGTAGEESYGMGLFISKVIVEEHEGKIWFESETGKGSAFYVELPYTANN